jgi:hypothetical protein
MTTTEYIKLADELGEEEARNQLRAKIDSLLQADPAATPAVDPNAPKSIGTDLKAAKFPFDEPVASASQHDPTAGAFALLDPNAPKSIGTDLKAAKFPFDEPVASASQHDPTAGAFALFLGLVIGFIVFLLVRPPRSVTNQKGMARLWMAWGLWGSIVMAAANIWHGGDFNAVVKALIGVALNGAVAWLLGLGFGWIKFSFLQRIKNEGRSAVAVSRGDFAAALEAANRGDLQAQYQMALRYYYGTGVVKNTLEAYKWVLLAQAGGVTEALRLCRRIEKCLSREEIAYIQGVAGEFRAEADIE